MLEGCLQIWVLLLLVRHLSGEARRLVLNLPPNEQTTGRAIGELRVEYSDMQTSLDPLADFYERCQRHGESVCLYAIALEATLHSVEEAQFEGQPFSDRDSNLTHQFLRGLSDEEVYHRLAPSGACLVFWGPQQVFPEGPPSVDFAINSGVGMGIVYILSLLI